MVAKSAVQVLTKMAATVLAANPGAGTPGTYTPNSCYGACAHWLRRNNNMGAFILLFGDSHKVTHCALYSDGGKALVDTFHGAPVEKAGKVFYVAEPDDLEDEAYPLLYAIKVGRFYDQYVQPGKARLRLIR